MALFGGIHRNHVLFYIRIGSILRSHFNLLGIVHEITGEFADGIGKSGGKQQRLALLGQHLHNGTDIVDKAHIQHTVGFIEYHYFNFAQVDVFLFDMIQQTADGSDDDFAAGAQIGGLLIHIDTAKQHRMAQRQVFNITLYVLIDLVGQFAGGREHQHAYGMHGRRGARRCITFQALEAGQHKGGGFAGAGLCGGQKVVPGQCFGNRRGLDGRGRFIALLG